MHTADFQQSLHAAELAGLACFARAVLGHAMEDGDDVVALRFTVTHSADERAVIEAELINRGGLAVGGFAL